VKHRKLLQYPPQQFSAKQSLSPGNPTARIAEDEAKEARLLMRRERREGNKATHKKQNRYGAHENVKNMYWQNQKRYMNSVCMGGIFCYIPLHISSNVTYSNILHRLLVELN